MTFRVFSPIARNYRSHDSRRERATRYPNRNSLTASSRHRTGWKVSGCILHTRRSFRIPGIGDPLGARYGLELLAYTLMTNHVHYVVVPHEEDSLRWTFQMIHERYAEYINAQNQWIGHLWQAKFFSSLVDEAYFWVAQLFV
jgi:hypothetical protein